jgi:hypothetical protein
VGDWYRTFRREESVPSSTDLSVLFRRDISKEDIRRHERCLSARSFFEQEDLELTSQAGFFNFCRPIICLTEPDNSLEIDQSDMLDYDLPFPLFIL